MVDLDSEGERSGLGIVGKCGAKAVYKRSVLPQTHLVLFGVLLVSRRKMIVSKSSSCGHGVMLLTSFTSVIFVMALAIVCRCLWASSVSAASFFPASPRALAAVVPLPQNLAFEIPAQHDLALRI